MSRRRAEPIWLSLAIVTAIHEDQVRQHGGLGGVRDQGLLESALGRPRHRWAYGEAPDLCDLAASYGTGIARNHPFHDGNKRTAFQAMFTFLGVNGFDLVAAEAEAVETMLAVATGRMREQALAAWLRRNGRKVRARGRRRRP